MASLNVYRMSSGATEVVLEIEQLFKVLDDYIRILLHSVHTYKN